MHYITISIFIILFSVSSLAQTTFSGGQISSGKITSSDTLNSSQDSLIDGKYTFKEVLNEKTELYFTPDITQKTIGNVKEWYEIAIQNWGLIGPLEIYIIGNKISDAKVLEDYFCQKHVKLDKEWKKKFNLEGWSVKYDCASDRHKIFTQYVEDGGASISTYRKEHLNYEFYVMKLASKRPNPNEEDYKVTLLHEYFHVYQHHNISGKCSDDRRKKCERDKKATGEYDKRPWFHEGGAEYSGQLLYRETTGNKKYFFNQMKRKLKKSLNRYKSEYNMDLKSITYKKDKNIAYDIGSWFIAYLYSKEGEEKHKNNFYKDLDKLGFEGSFVKNFGKSSDEYIEEFNKFITKPWSQIQKVLP